MRPGSLFLKGNPVANRNDIIVKLRLAGEEFDRDFKIKFQDLTDAAEKASAQSGAKAGSSFGKGFASALGAAGAGIGLAINQAANLGAEIASTSKQFNIGVESLQVWRKAASIAGVTADDLNSGIANLTQKIGEANAGNRQAQEGFVGLGIGFKTAAGEARATDAVMLDLAKRIAAIEDPAKRVQLGTQLLGDDFRTLYPLLLDGADGFNKTAEEARRFGEVLTAKEIQDLDATNRKIEDLKNQLAVSVAKQVAENADAILGLADAIATLTGSMIKYVSEYPRFAGALAGAAAGYRAAGPWGAAAGGLGGLYVGQGVARDQADANKDPAFRAARLQEAQERLAATTRGTVDRSNDPVARRAGEELVRQYGLYRAAIGAANGSASGSARAEQLEAPRVDAPRASGVGSRRTGGGSTRRPEKTEEEKQNDAALKAEDRMREAVARTLQEQRDSAEVAGVRKFLGERAAVIAEAELALARQLPGVQAQTVEGLGKALGYSEDMVKARRAELELQLASNKAALEGEKAKAAEKFDAEDTSKRQREIEDAKERAKRAADDWRREHEQAVRDVAIIYEDLFTGGTKSLWRNFKDEGRRIIADIAAQWTLAMISGQGFSLNAAASGAMGRSPLASIFMGAGGGFGAANDNGGFGGLVSFGRPIDFNPVLSGRGAASGGLLPTGGELPTTGGGFDATLRTPFLESPGFALGLGTLTTSLVGGGQASQLGGLVGSIGGQQLGSMIGALGKFGGPVGAIAGALLGSILPKVIASPKRASVTVGGLNGTLGITGRQGNSAARDATATQGAGSLIDAIFQIADQLGGGVDASRGSVSFGMRKNSFRVDPTGRGITKVGNGAVDFGSDQEAAIRFAISDLIKDGVITGISQASQNLLSKGGDLDQQIEKALLLEQIPKLLKQRTDPLGAALDELYDKFKRVNDALVEGSASAEQFAQARQLWELEKADAIATAGAIAQPLKDFLSGLQAGSNSPLSLREQRAEAERQLQPFLSQISAAEAARAEVERLRGSGASAADIAAAEQAARTAASAINQDGFTQASQLLLSISRQSNASSGAFFSDFDRIRALTGQAIGIVEQGSARGADSRDPFGKETAQNTADTAAIVAEHTLLLRDIRDALVSRGVAVGNGFLDEPRAFVR